MELINKKKLKLENSQAIVPLMILTSLMFWYFLCLILTIKKLKIRNLELEEFTQRTIFYRVNLTLCIVYSIVYTNVHSICTYRKLYTIFFLDIFHTINQNAKCKFSTKFSTYACRLGAGDKCNRKLYIYTCMYIYMYIYIYIYIYTYIIYIYIYEINTDRRGKLVTSHNMVTRNQMFHSPQFFFSFLLDYLGNLLLLTRDE